MSAPASPNRSPLTPRQRSVLSFLRRRLREAGPPPTNAEIAETCRLGAPSGAHRIVAVLDKRGYVERGSGKSRALALATAPLGPHPPGSPARLVLDAVRVLQSAARDRVLRTAAVPGLDPERKGALLRDAADRNDFVQRYHPADDAPGDARADAFGQLLVQLGQESTWAEFVVDHLVFNEGSIVGAEQLLPTIPELEPVFLEIIDLSNASLRRCRRWLVDVIDSGEHDRDELQRRAVLMQQVSRVSAGMIEAQLDSRYSLATPWGDDWLEQLVAPDSAPAGASRG